MDEIDLQRLYSIVGQYFEPMMNRFQGLSDGENNDRFVARVTIGGVRGMYTIMEGIVLRGERGQLWAAYIDEDVVRYFTTDANTKQRYQKPLKNGERDLRTRVLFSKQRLIISTTL